MLKLAQVHAFMGNQSQADSVYRTLLEKEIRRFMKVPGQTLLGPVVSTRKNHPAAGSLTSSVAASRVRTSKR